MKQFVCYIFILIAGAVAGMLLSRICHTSHPKPETIIRTDTLYLRDTNIYRFPDMISEITIPEETIIIHDSLIIISDSVGVLPVQQKHYREDEYEAWVSGYRPQLDSCRVFPETKYVTKTVQDMRKPTRWGIGIQAGYGVGVSSGQIRAFPYIGVGFSYNIIQF